ncbi:unnamed protein product [Ceutorhynchus assimilis]|uniref:Uncharacterized protein n=1 Tax=Ceutorhynchus assimilis TaxID=467358 RepID=A0A9P0DHX9_9CUCU|nr:unnamed protein product [Ceutorhynchus assimilis]
MPVIDKAVSTEDLCSKEVPPALGVLRLEAILNTLVENKVESLKLENGKTSSLHSSPKSFLQKLKCQPTVVTVENEKKTDPKRKVRKDKNHGHKVVLESRQFKRQMLRQETSSPDSQILQCPTGHQYRSSSCIETTCPSHVCYCNQGPVSMQATDDYISIKMDGYGDIETDAIIAQEELRRARRKRRRRRKRRLKKRLALNPHLVDTLVHESEFKSLNDDELPPRAKWTIVATACLLFFMCLLLVGITLRMAPIIDEIVREENEKMINSISNPANLSLSSVHNNAGSTDKLYVLNGVT